MPVAGERKVMNWRTLPSLRSLSSSLSAMPQAAHDAFGHSLHHALGVGPARPALVHRAQRDQVFLLRGDELRTVDLHQRLAALDRFSSGVYVQSLDPPLETRRYPEEQPLVRLDRADRLDRAPQVPLGGGFGPHAKHLHLVGTDPHRAGGCRRLFALVDGDVVHAHGVLLRHRRDIGQPHRVAVMENLALALLGARADGRSARSVACGVSHSEPVARAERQGDRSQPRCDGYRALHSGLPVRNSISASALLYAARLEA